MVTDQYKINVLKSSLLAVAGGGVALLGYIWYKRKHSIPKGVEPLTGFEVEKYIGKWYEIARLERHFERYLVDTTASYHLNEDGTLSLQNRGFNLSKQRWEKSEGIMRFINDPNVAALEVSYFGPFFSGYNVVAIEGDYEYALVVGRNRKLCWLLSRTPKMPVDVQTILLSKAMSIGVDINSLTWVEHQAGFEQEDQKEV